MTRIGPGVFVAVVGASGAGKDSLIDYARARCDAYFPRRVITRPPGAGEEYHSVSVEDFENRCARAEFAVHWCAHGLRYGIPVDADEAVRRGATVIANVSRGVLDELSLRYQRVTVVRVEVSDEVRRARLRSRGREPAVDVATRLSRSDPAPHRTGDVRLRNDGPLAQAGDELVRIIVGR